MLWYFFFTLPADEYFEFLMTCWPIDAFEETNVILTQCVAVLVLLFWIGGDFFFRAFYVARTFSRYLCEFETKVYIIYTGQSSKLKSYNRK